MVNPRRARAGLLLAAALLPAALAGCGEAGPPRVALHPASGRVLVDGAPAAKVNVRCRPAADPDSLDAPVPFATTDDGGNFELGTYDAGDGAPVGRYKVTLFWPDRPPGPRHPDDLLGGAYATARRTPLEATIAEGRNTIPAFEVAKPAARPSRPPAKGRRADEVDGLD